MTRSFLSSILFFFFLSALLPSSINCETLSYCAIFSPVTNGKGGGTAEVIYDSTAHTLTLKIEFSGVTSPIINSHIHACTTNPLNGTAAPATAVSGFPSFPSATSGNYQYTLNLQNDTVWNSNFITMYGDKTSAENNLTSCLSTGRAYINLHNNNFTGGEINGFLQAVTCASLTPTTPPTTPKPSNIITKCSDSVCAHNGTCIQLAYYPWVKCACRSSAYSGVFCTVLGKSSPRITFTINKDIRYITDEILFRTTVVNEISLASGAALNRIEIQEMALTEEFKAVRLSVTISPSLDPLSLLTAEDAIYTLRVIVGNPNSVVYKDKNLIYLSSVDLESVVIDTCPYGLGLTVCSNSAINSMNSFDAVDDWEASTSIGIAVFLSITLTFFGLLFIPKLGVLCRPRTNAEKNDINQEEYNDVPHTPVKGEGGDDDDAERAPWQSPKGKGGGKGSFSYQG